jgi:acyl transferase domain-containing protein
MNQIAIVGMECCFPGAENLNTFWHLLQSGTDAISEIPKQRWDIEKLYDSNFSKVGKMNTRRGGFLKNIDKFDADFFGVSPREAERVDPQQRLVLEVVWKALENANIAADTLDNTLSGVFMGIARSDYALKLSNNQKYLESLSAYDGTGNSLGVAANRLSYTLNLKGPSLSIETGCSSSLVAVHYACKSLLTNESNLCIAGGVNLMLTPDLTVIYSNAGMMASDGRCKTFDAEADGYVRGEGCGIVILKRLEDAIRDGNNIKAVIKGSAVNQDGRTNGITAPNGPSQQKVIRQALKNSRVLPSQVSYVEAHGTGTPLGDPIEANSLKAVLSEGRLPGDVCWIGSVKTNIGHLEAAAGIASLIKTVLSLQKREIPAHLNLERLNSNIHLDRAYFRIPKKCISWNVNKETRIAGISSFGFGGTNCHIVVEEASKLKLNNNNVQHKEHSLNLLQLSAKTQPALQSLAEKYIDFLELHPEINISDICYSARVGRKHFKQRLAILVESKHQLYQSLTDFYQNGKSERVITYSKFVKKPKKVAFLFTGQSKKADFGRFLYEKNSVFRRTIDYCSDISKSYLEYSLQEVLYPSSDSNSQLIENSVCYQLAVFAFEYSLYQLWKSLGVKPNVVMGHSLGEYVAACVSGLISAEDAMRLVAERGRLTQKFSGKGTMFAVFASEEQVSTFIREANQEDVVVAAVNSPENTVISGNIEAVKEVIELLSTHDISSVELGIPNHFHSPLLQPIIQDFQKITDQIEYLPPEIPFVSGLDGKLLSAETLTSNYWCQHLLQPVLFKAGVETLNKQGCEIFLEIGSESALIKMAQRCLPDTQNLWVSSLNSQLKLHHLLETLGKLYVSGVTTAGSIEDKEENPRNLIELPTYSFQSQKYWSNHNN